MKNHAHTNALINETSPYLLQHAHNPVNWYPWNEETLAKAKSEGKLLIISIGYSACHWCHVMEHESFEDEEVAQIMNDRFINIKVDREERPDVDQVYMEAVQLMQQRGGWPLNCIALPDGRPVWGGTYFPKGRWMEQIEQVANFYVQKPKEMLEYAEKLAKGIQLSELVTYNSEEASFSWNDLESMLNVWQSQFDNKEGGPNKAPKFPIPNNYQFLMRYAHLRKDNQLHEYVQLTLDKMAYGGIYDQVGGGFARYSTDKLWKIPHFEKMLYDNAQLVSLYSEAFLAYGKPLYQETVVQTLEFIERELSDTSGAFYSALDADSEGEEGKFYIWKKEELKALIGNDYALFSNYYNVDSKGFWEYGNYILLRDKSDLEFCQKEKIEPSTFREKVRSWNTLLLQEREKRERPGLDDKSLTSWNAMMCKGYVDAYLAFGNTGYLNKAIKNANFILNQQLQTDGSLWHSYKNGKSTINGFLEDYAFTIEAFVRLYEATFEAKWLRHSEALVSYCKSHFYDTESGMFYFTSSLDAPLVARKMEVNDNVIPASSSTMANNLFLLGQLLGNEDYLQMAKVQLNNIKAQLPSYPSGYSNWASLMLKNIAPFYEVAVVGANASSTALELYQKYHPNTLLLGSTDESDLPLLKNKMVKEQTTIYVCQNKSCQLPTTEIKQALNLIQ
ncbi:MAG: thioredoxin domain-containing protein [Flavobacteriales bacterium]|nr:thioredoxin domain-containing protein [Flavobacteriales bacterium]MBL6872828.1 thioredoxin domain-containing protein [Flavobacteriales bacterium]